MKSKKEKAKSEFSLLQWSGLVIISIFFIFFPFQAGLFNGWDYPYEKSILQAMILCCILLIILSFYLIFRNWRPDNWNSILTVGVWLLPAIYCLSSIQAVSKHNAQFMTLISFTLSAFFVFGIYFQTTSTSRKLLESVVMISGYAIVLYGLLNYFGQTYANDALWFTLDTYRLSSVFQYPNTYAGLLSALFLASLYYTTHAQKWHWRFVHALMLVPVFVSLILTLSRTALVILPFIILIVLPFLRLAKQVIYLLNMVVSVVCSFAISGGMEKILAEVVVKVFPKNEGEPATPLPFWNTLSLKGWLLVLFVSLLTALVAIAVQRWVEPWLENRLTIISQKKWARAAVPAGLVILGMIAAVLLLASPAVRGLLPTAIAERLENINFNQHSVLERATFYKDGIRLTSDYPLLGAGGGGWTALFEQYQSNPYFSRQAHSYLIQTLVETGWIGLFIHLAFAATVFYLYIRNCIRHPEKFGSHFIYYIFAAAILIHSFFDFDMSYLSIAALVFFCLGSMMSAYASNETSLIKNPVSNLDWKGWRLAFPVFMGLITVTFSFFVFKEYYANTQYTKALILAQEQKPLSELTVPLDHAIQASPAHPRFLLVKSDWMKQAYAQTGNPSYLQEAKKVLDKLKHYDPYNRLAILAMYRYYKDANELENAIQELEEGIRKFPWDIEFYETAIFEYYRIGEQQLLENANNIESWNYVLNLYNEIERRMKQLEDLPEQQLQGRRFDISPEIRQLVAQIYYYTDREELTVELLRPMIHNSDLSQPLGRTSVRFYLAALDAIGQHDDGLKRQLIAADPEEERYLNELMMKQK